MGMVNYAWDDFMEWVDAGVEIVSPHERKLVHHSPEIKNHELQQ